MKKVIFSVICFLIFSAGLAQVIQKPTQLPSGQPGKRSLPVPDIKPLLPDLVVTALSYVSGEKDAAAGEYKLTINLTIKNTGAANAATCKLYGDYETESTHGKYWASSFNGIDLPAITGGSTISGNYIFRFKLTALGRGNFSFPFKTFIDKYNVVKESNELNNLSDPITITVSL